MLTRHGTARLGSLTSLSVPTAGHRSGGKRGCGAGSRIEHWGVWDPGPVSWDVTLGLWVSGTKGARREGNAVTRDKG